MTKGPMLFNQAFVLELVPDAEFGFSLCFSAYLPRFTISASN